MEGQALNFIGAGLMAFGMMGAAIGVGNVAAAALNGIARNPAAEAKMSKYFYIGASMAEAMGIFALVLAFLLKG